MRLLNAKSLEFKEFFDEEIPPYIILSHRWGKDEVSYQIFAKRHKEKNQAFLAESPGYQKILDFCSYGPRIWLEKYRKQHDPEEIEWTWIDTCCIDKRSSAELSEAINSMFRWYQKAELCCAYLVDVEDESTFSKSEWFARGWTLQELLAPKNLEFIDCKWRCLGGKASRVREISRITNIDPNCLLGTSSLWTYSVACRLSWASRRKTSRIEDESYCLLGIFEVSMPLLYGEGKYAFHRLQEEIIRVSGDQSILAFSRLNHKLLARELSQFATGKHVQLCLPVRVYPNDLKPYQMTNRGLEIEVADIQSAVHGPYSDADSIIAVLCCMDRLTGLPILLQLQRIWGPTWSVIPEDQIAIWAQLPDAAPRLLEQGKYSFKRRTVFIVA